MALSISSSKYLFYSSRFYYSALSYFGLKYNFLSTMSHGYDTLIQENLKSVQFPKSVQPFVTRSIDEILSIVNPKLTSDESVSLLKTLRMHRTFKNVEPNIYKDNKSFETLCQIFEKKCISMKPNLLISGLRSLLEIGVPHNSSYVISAEQCILNNIHTLSSFDIIVCLYFHHRFIETDLQKKVVDLLIQELCKKSSDIASSSEILMLVHFLHIFNGENQKKIQHKIVQLIPLLNTQEMCKIFNALAEKSNRNIYILNALSFHLSQKQELPALKDILDILFSFKKLNFIDKNLLSTLENKITDDIPSITQPSIISRLLSVCGHLKWRQMEILNLCSAWIIDNLQSCRPKEFVSYILAAAILNYDQNKVQETLNVIMPFLTYKSVRSPDTWLDVVWSLAILGKVEKEMLLNVFSPDFYTPLISNSDFNTVTNKLKLMNLKAVLKVYYPENIFSCNLYLEPENLPQNADIENGRKHVIKILSNFIPKDKYMCINQNTDMGVFIDAEFVINQEMKPLLLSKYGILSKPTKSKSLPEGSHRIALLLLFHKDFTLNYESPVGYISLAEKLLSANGYTVVKISFLEFMKHDTEVKKVKYLWTKIKEAVDK